MSRLRLSTRSYQFAITALLPIVLYGCGGGGGQHGIDVSGDRAVILPSSQRSVRLNNYNNWWFLSDDDKAARLKKVAMRDNICFTEAATWTGITPQAIKAVNPFAKVYQVYALCFKNIYDTDWNNPADLTRMVTPVTKAQIVSNDWWLRDGKGEIVKESGGGCYLDVGKPGFKEAFLQTMLSRLAGKGFDGVVFDYWYPTIENDYMGNKPKGWFSSQSMPAAYPNNQVWYIKAWQPFISYVTDGLHRAGYRIIGNCAGEYNSGSPEKDWQRSKVDGTVYEQWAVDWDGTWLPGSKIQKRIQSFSTDPMEAWTADFGLRGSDEEYDRKQKVGLAMYYIGIPASQEKRSYHHYSDAKVYWEPIWDFQIGTPAATAVKMSGKYFWSRKFTSGLVLLNYENSGSINYTLDRAYCDLSGKVYIGSITIPARTGVILAIVRSPSCCSGGVQTIGEISRQTPCDWLA